MREQVMVIIGDGLSGNNNFVGQHAHQGGSIEFPDLSVQSIQVPGNVTVVIKNLVTRMFSLEISHGHGKCLVHNIPVNMMCYHRHNIEASLLRPPDIR